MANVKVHLRELIKYVLLLGLGIQMVLGCLCCILWLSNQESPGEIFRSLGGMLFWGVLAYAFLSVQNVGWSGGRYRLIMAGILTTPMVLQAGLSIDLEDLSAFWVLVAFIILFIIIRRMGKNLWKVAAVSMLFLGTMCLCTLGENTTLAARLAGRFCIPYVVEGMGNVPQEIIEDVGYLELLEGLRSSDGIEEKLYPSLLERYGSVEKADEICYRLAEYGLSYNTKGIVLDILWEWVGYHIPMLASELQLQGLGGDGYTGYNYGQLLEQTGKTGIVYWRYNVAWNVLSYVLLLILFLGEKKTFPVKEVAALGLLELVIICRILLGAGHFDYTQILVVPFLWAEILGNYLETSGD